MTTATSNPAAINGAAASPRMNTKLARRRLVAYSTFADISADLDKVEAAHRAGALRHLGNRAPGPIFGHLAISMRGSVEGMDHLRKTVPIWLRLGGSLLRNRILSAPLRPGVNLPSAAEPILWNDATPFDAGLKDFRSELTRFADPKTAPTAAHPVFGKLTPDQWRTFHIRHAELHMSFLQP